MVVSLSGLGQFSLDELAFEVASNLFIFVSYLNRHVSGQPSYVYHQA